MLGIFGKSVTGECSSKARNTIKSSARDQYGDWNTKFGLWKARVTIVICYVICTGVWVACLLCNFIHVRYSVCFPYLKWQRSAPASSSKKKTIAFKFCMELWNETLLNRVPLCFQNLGMKQNALVKFHSISNVLETCTVVDFICIKIISSLFLMFFCHITRFVRWCITSFSIMIDSHVEF